MIPVVSKNTNELKTHAPGRFVLDVSTLGSPMEARILGDEHAEPALDIVGPRHGYIRRNLDRVSVPVWPSALLGQRYRSGLSTSCKAIRIAPFEYRSKLNHLIRRVSCKRKRRLEEWRKNP